MPHNLPLLLKCVLLCGLLLAAAPRARSQEQAIGPTLVSDSQLEEMMFQLQATETRLQVLERDQRRLWEAQLGASVPRGPDAPLEKRWYEKYSIRGYAQFRINETLGLRSGSAPAHHAGDGSVGDGENFFIRRARLIFFGDINEYVYLYFQPDFASTPPGSPDGNHFGQIRDLYADIHLDTSKEYRFRVGQSKVPYGWENMQSSQNRLPLDRNDALNSAVKNERDLGVFFYWTPEWTQDIFRYVLEENLKGSGNYGLLGIGFYNGQGGSLREQNDNVHLVTRVQVPMVMANGQIIEMGFQAYTGKYVVLSSPISPLGVGAPERPLGTLETGNQSGTLDERIAATFVYYPQPWGFQTEWTVGRGPSLNDAQTEVIDRALYGGYAMTMYRHVTDNYGEVLPFVRWAYYQGGYKSERNAPFSKINEWELGIEWQMSKAVELVGMYTITDRTNTRAISAADSRSYEQFRGDLLRIQLQVSY